MGVGATSRSEDYGLVEILDVWLKLLDYLNCLVDTGNSELLESTCI
jgi:hypothetical protein